MRILLAFGVIAQIFVLSLDAAACHNDFDCSAGSRCVKSFEQMEGTCKRGVEPVEGEPRRQIGDPYAPKGSVGELCEFTSDCASGLSCVERRNSAAKVCSY